MNSYEGVVPDGWGSELLQITRWGGMAAPIGQILPKAKYQEANRRTKETRSEIPRSQRPLP